MEVIRARNVNGALASGLRLLAELGVERDSRAGRVKVMPTPVTTLYRRPLEKVVFHPLRDANPFFHLFEGLWMIAGRDDVAYVARFNSNIAKVASDDGERFHGAYGKRWFSWFGFDQLGVVAATLKRNPEDRRQVIQMWDPRADLGGSGKDYPCNLCIHVERDARGRLDLKVFCRSNDLVWGTCGSDSVDFAMLQEYLAAMIGCEVGCYWQISSNYHGYLKTLDPLAPLADWEGPCRYETGEVRASPMVVEGVDAFNEDLGKFLGSDATRQRYREPFFEQTAKPMLEAWDHYKDKEYVHALAACTTIRDSDWRLACYEWVTRRYERWLAS